MRYDEVYKHIGDIGVFQTCIFVYVFLFALFFNDNSTYIFSGSTMPHWCMVPELDALSYERQRYIAVPPTDGSASDGEETFSQCEMYAFNYSAFSYEELNAWNRSVMVTNTTVTVRCSEWVYEQTKWLSTVVSQDRNDVAFWL